MFQRFLNIFSKICGKGQLFAVAEHAGKFLLSGELLNPFWNMIMLKHMMKLLSDDGIRFKMFVADKCVIVDVSSIFHMVAP